MPKFKVKPYENYLDMYPNSFEVRTVFPAGSIVTVEDPSKDNQMNKLEPYEEPKVSASAGAPANAGAPVTTTVTAPVVTNDSPAVADHEDKETKRKKAQQALAGF